MNKCNQCAFLQTTDMLKCYISLQLCLFMFSFQSYVVTTLSL